MTAPLPPRRVPPPPPPAPPAPVSFGGTIGALAVAIGFGVVVAHMLDLHGHTCDRCGRRWRHFGAFNLGDEKSHTCVSCGEVQWWKCGAPHVLRGSQFAKPPSTWDPEVPTLAASTGAGPGAHSSTAPVFSAAPAAPRGLPSPATPALVIQPRRVW